MRFNIAVVCSLPIIWVSTVAGQQPGCSRLDCPWLYSQIQGYCGVVDANELRVRLDLWNGAKIVINKCPCATTTSSNCTNVGGLRPWVVNGLIDFQKESKLSLMISGGSESTGGHSPSGGHPAGEKVDLVHPDGSLEGLKTFIGYYGKGPGKGHFDFLGVRVRQECNDCSNYTGDFAFLYGLQDGPLFAFEGAGNVPSQRPAHFDVTFTMSNAVTLTPIVQKVGSGTGRILIDPSPCEDAAPCPSFTRGLTAYLTAEPSPQSLFDGWTGVDTSDRLAASATLLTDRTVTATFVEDVPPPTNRACWTRTLVGWVWSCPQRPPTGGGQPPPNGCWHWDPNAATQGAWILDDCGGKKWPTGPITSVGVEIVAPNDPNEKVGSQGAGASHFVARDQPLKYSIYFENKPTATAAAQDVVVRDVLDKTRVDVATLTLGPIAFGQRVITPPAVPLAAVGSFNTDVDLRPQVNLIARVLATLDNNTGTLTWTFRSIDPATNQPTTDPILGFLPIGGEGSVAFSLLPQNTLTTNTAVPNKATVVFDGTPLDTPLWSNSIDATNPVSRVSPLAVTQSTASFSVVWSGSDVGSGVQDYTVYVSDNGGAYTTWQKNTAAISAAFTGQPAHTYRFYSIARDLVGNTEAAKTTAEATTTVQVAEVPGDLNNDGKVDCADIAIIGAAFGKRTGQPGFDPRADVVADGVIDVRDLAFVSQRLPVGTVCQ